MSSEGRSCPIHYRYTPESLCQAPETLTEDVLYVIGGLYGNTLALDEIEAMAAAEEAEGRRVKLLFNGDFNWFNASDELFSEVNQRVLRHDAMLGNVEYELAHPSNGAGCGCAYPEFVASDVVSRSNRIMARLQAVADRHSDIQAQLAGLARFRCMIFGGLKVLILHGDPESLAGWGLSYESFAQGNNDQLAAWFRATGADIMLCTHTCLPLIWQGVVDGRPRQVLNNGSAGMGNLMSDSRGLIARLSTTKPFNAPVAGIITGRTQLSLMPVRFDQQAWRAQFDALWPAGSDAELSYRARIVSGTDLSTEALYFSAGVSA
ncbi:MAG: hypothetical protein WD623_04050 [Marinobacter sp.]|uniref:hypothetical protein n=1 Tax=Marinobacter sp. TaxID=50741 RepID=UPI0034A01005